MVAKAKARVPPPVSVVIDELHATLGRFALVLGLPRDAFVWVDHDANIVWCNTAFERMVGVEHLMLLGTPLAERLVLERAGRPITGDAHPAHRILVETEALSEAYEMAMDNDRAVVEVVAKRGLIEDKTIAVLVVHDITEGARAAAAMAALNAKLEAANNELEAFSYSISHDLRTPLRAIDGFSLALLEDYSGVLDDEGKAYLQRLRKAALTMGQLIEDMLHLSRVTRSELAWRDVDLSAMARDIVQDLSNCYPEREVDVSIQDGLMTRGDDHLLRLLLQNLIENAWKFTSKTANARIEVGSMPRNGSCVYFVRDNGAGFDAAHADRMFGAFQRLHSANEFPGTGIGLAIVRRVIHRHGGRVWAEGSVGKGATFYFTLPGETASAPWP